MSLISFPFRFAPHHEYGRKGRAGLALSARLGMTVNVD